jgi:putative NIF3 family GTP cyclohydrolase 1 type 2
MTVTDIFSFVIEKAKKQDPRGIKALDQVLQKEKEKRDILPENERWEFDEDRLWNPYLDSCIIHNSNNPEVKRILMGINVGSAELLVADQLTEKGKPIDLVIAHHPQGKGMAALADVMDIQVDIYKRWGVPVNVSEHLMEPRIAEVMRGVMPANHNQAADTARLLDIPFMGTHSPADILVQEFMQAEMDRIQPVTLGDILSQIKTYPEYRHATRSNNPPKILVGKPENRAGRIAVKFSGGTGGTKHLYEAFKQAGVGTVMYMHIKEDHLEEARKHQINVVIPGHMASDSMGMNLLFGELEEKGIEVMRFSGLYPPTDL